MKKIVHTHQAPAPVGPYNQAVTAGNFIFTAGQIALDPATGKLVGDDVKEQTRQMIQNLEAVLKAGGSDLLRVVKTTVFLNDMNDFTAMNEVYGEFFADNPPARSAIEVGRLPKGALVEIEAVAVTE